MGDLDLQCYGCGTLIRADVAFGDVEDLDAFKCRYCGSTIPFFMRSTDRKKSRELASEDQPWQQDDASDGSLGPDGRPLTFGISFVHGPFLQNLVAAASPPRVTGEDRRQWRETAAERKLYAESLTVVLNEVAPRLPFQVNGRSSREAGGPGVSTDEILIAISAVIAYPAVKEIAKDLRATIEKLRILAAGEAPEITDGVAVILARDILADQLGITDSTLRSVSARTHTEDYYQVLEGYVVDLTAGGVLYVVAFDPDGTLRRVNQMPDPWAGTDADREPSQPKTGAG